MIIECAWCKRKMGEKAPYADKGSTSTMCPKCEKREYAKMTIVEIACTKCGRMHKSNSKIFKKHAEFTGFSPKELKKDFAGYMSHNPPGHITVGKKSTVLGLENTFLTRSEAVDEYRNIRDSGKTARIMPHYEGYAVYEEE